MSIKAKCPNPACGKVLTIKEEYAGKTGKCPACGMSIKIPASAAQAPASKPSAASAGPPPRAPAKTAPTPPRPKVEAEADYEVVEDDPPPPPVPKSPPREPKPVPPGKRPSPPPSKPKPIADDIEEPELIEDVEVLEDVEVAEVPEEEADEARLPRKPAPGKPEPSKRRARADDVDEIENLDEEKDRPRPKRRRDEEEVADEEEETDRYRRSGGGGWAPKWDLVAVGFLIVFIAACISGGAQAFLVLHDLLMFMGLLAKSISLFEVALALVKIAAVGAFVASIPMAVGYVFCLFVPTKHGALGLAIALLALGVVNLVMGLVFKLLPLFERNFLEFAFAFYGRDTGDRVLILFVHLLVAAELILLALYMRALCLNAKDKGRAQECQNLVYFAAGYAGARLFDFILQLVASNATSSVMAYVYLLVRLLIDGALAFVLVMYLRVIFDRRDMVRFRLARKSAARG